MKEICLQDKCTGCWACVNACPKSCISMVEGELFHLFPAIDQSRCVDCGLCVKTCPANHPVAKEMPLNTYASLAKDATEYKTSTSGGAAAVLTRKAIAEGGVAYGCAFHDKSEVGHVRIDRASDLYQLKGSKYVQSSIGHAYRKAKADLAQGRKVVFFGTPCQVAGLKNFLRKPYDNLLTVDLICHGVPSLGYLRRHLKRVTGYDHYDSVKFREGNGMYVVVVVVDKAEAYRSDLWNHRYEDTYYNAFIDGYTYRRSCHACPYADAKRVSDITVGDFWGLKDDLPVVHREGLSCILANTPKGKVWIDAVANDMHLFERNLDESVAGNAQLRAPLTLSRRMKVFMRLQRFVGIDRAYRLCEYDHIHPRVGKLLKIFKRPF